MELESEDQILHSVPSILGVSQKQDGNSESCNKKSSKHDAKDAAELNQAVGNGVTTPETKTDTVQEVLPLAPNILPESILAEIDEPMTKAINLNSNLFSSDVSVMNVERQSPLQRNSINSKGYDKGFSHNTKEEVKVLHLANVSDSEVDTHTRTSDTLGKKKERPDFHQDSNQAACKNHILLHEKTEGSTGAMPDAVQEEVCEALDLSLPKKKARDSKETCRWVLDSGYEGALLMEVDEIEDDTQHTEVEQDDSEEYWYPFRNNDETKSYPPNIPSPPCDNFPSLDPKDTLLIDDQGIPYTLTPDGQKVPQIDLTDLPEMASEELRTGFMPFDNEATVSDQDEDSAQELFPPDLPLVDSSPDLSHDTLRLEKTSSHDSVVETKSETIPVISSLPSLPIQIMASNTGSNTPILLLPQSQLQSLSSSAGNANSGVMALSVPLALAQNTQSPPVFLLLSSPQISSAIPSSTLSGQLSQISSTSSVELPSISSSVGLNPETVSCTASASITTTTTTDLSGQNKPYTFSSTPTSPTASISTSSVNCKQVKTEPRSDAPTSFQEALLRLAQKAENLPKPIETASVVAPSTCSEATESESPPVLDTLVEHCKTERGLSPVSEPASVKVDQTDSLLNHDSADSLPPPSSTSPLHSTSPIFPTNHPKNQDSQALGPRRILYCQYCPRVFYYVSDLERHSITHSQNKPHVCQLCGKAFKRSSHLERHKHIHTGQRNFVCQLCPRRFREAAELTRHQRVHTGEKPYQCLLCHMRFAERNTLRRHTKRKHQGQQQEAMSMKVKPEAEGVPLLGIQGQEEENAEWYSSTMAEVDSDSDTGGE